MRLLIINDYLVKGGAEMQSIREKEIFERYGNDVMLLTFDNKYNEGEILHNKSKGFYNIPITENYKNKIYLRYKINKGLLNKINNIIDGFNPDVIHANNLNIAPLTQYMSLAGYKVVQTIRDYNFVCPAGTCIYNNDKVCSGIKHNNCLLKCGVSNLKVNEKFIRYKMLEKLRKNIVSQFICPSEKLTEYCNRHEFNTICINNPFDFKKFDKFIKNIDVDNKKYLYYGSISKIKGVYNLIDAFNIFSLNKNVELYIIGKIECDINELKRRINNNSKIKLLDQMDYSDIIKFLEEVYAIVVPSLWMENYPNTVLEGLATKTLVLGSNRGGIPDMLDNERGIVFDVLDDSSIVNSLNKSYSLTSDKYNDIVNNAYEYVNINNSVDTYYKRVRDIFNKLIKK